MDFFLCLRLQHVRIKTEFSNVNHNTAALQLCNLIQIHYCNGACILLKLCTFGAVHPLNIMCNHTQNESISFFIYLYFLFIYIDHLCFHFAKHMMNLLIYFLPFPCFTKNIFNREPDTKVCVCVCTVTPTLNKQTSHQRRWANVQKIAWIAILRKKERENRHSHLTPYLV